MNISAKTSRIFLAQTRSASRKRFLFQAQTPATTSAATIFRLARCSTNADIAETSETFFRRALQDDPASAEALYGLGSVYLQQQKPKEARESFERVLKLQASYPGTIPNAWNNLGILSAREGNTAAAIEFFQRALQIDPAHLIALLNLGNAYRQRKEWVEAKKALAASFRRWPG